MRGVTLVAMLLAAPALAHGASGSITCSTSFQGYRVCQSPDGYRSTEWGRDGMQFGQDSYGDLLLQFRGNLGDVSRRHSDVQPQAIDFLDENWSAGEDKDFEPARRGAGAFLLRGDPPRFQLRNLRRINEERPPPS